MAAAGEFPKVTGDIIYAADYNAIRNIAVDVVATTYGNSISSSAVAGGTVVSADQMDLLRGDVDRAYRHITNAVSGIADLATGGSITHTDWNAYKTAADYISTNRYSVHPSQLTTDVQSQTLAAGWNGDHIFWRRYTWPSNAARDYWFNAGGSFLVGVAGSGSDGSSKANDWQNNILEAIADQTYNRSNLLGTANFNVTEYGNVAQYTENYCDISFFNLSLTEFEIRVRINDVDTGDQTGTGPGIDENVGCNAGVSIIMYSSFDAITSTAPTVSAIQNW
jgi:hypothetical protein